MKIGIEAERANHQSKTGVEHYAHQLIQHLSLIDQVNNYELYLRSQPQTWLLGLPKNFLLRVMPFPKFWTQLRLGWEMLWRAPEVLLIPASALPLVHPRHSVVTVHDTAWIHFPESFTWAMRTFLHWSTKFAVARAECVIAVSSATKADLIRHYGVPADKVKVIHHGYTATLSGSAELSAGVAKQLPERYVLFLSTLQPRKNLPLLIDAFRRFKNAHPDFPHKLVVVGKPGWKFESILKKMRDNSDMVIYLNHISDEDRWSVYQKADLFVNPTLYEGFGMWLLEAFACGVPALVSDISSLPEVGGDAAMYFDPNDEVELAEKIHLLLHDSSLRQTLIQRGKNRLLAFSWEKCARETLALLQAVASSKNGV